MIKTLGDTGMGLVYFAHGKDMNFGASEGRLLWVELCPLKKKICRNLNPQYLRMCPYLQVVIFTEGIKLR